MLTKPLQKIATGMFVIASSFVVATVIEIVLEKTYPAVPGEAGGNMLTSRVAFHNALPTECTLALSVVRADDPLAFTESIEIQGKVARCEWVSQVKFFLRCILGMKYW